MANLIDCTVDCSSNTGCATSYLISSQYWVSPMNDAEKASLGIEFTMSGSTSVNGSLVYESETKDVNYKNSIKLEVGLYTEDPTSYIDADKYEVKKLDDTEDGYSEGYLYKVVAKSTD